MTLALRPPLRPAALPRPAQRAPIGQGAIPPALRAVSPYRNTSSFAQTAKLDALCFVIHTSSFCRNPLVLIFMQFARGCTPSENRCAQMTKFDALCFDNDTKPFCRNHPVLTPIQNPWGCTPTLGTPISRLALCPVPPSTQPFTRQKSPVSTSTSHGPNSLCRREDRRTMHRIGCGLYLQPAQTKVRGCTCSPREHAKEVRSGATGSAHAVRPQLPGRPQRFDRPSGLTGRQP